MYLLHNSFWQEPQLICQFHKPTDRKVFNKIQNLIEITIIEHLRGAKKLDTHVGFSLNKRQDYICSEMISETKSTV